MEQITFNLAKLHTHGTAFMSDDVDTHADRSQCLGLIVQGLVDVAAQNGASRLMSLYAPTVV